MLHRILGVILLVLILAVSTHFGINRWLDDPPEFETALIQRSTVEAIAMATGTVDALSQVRVGTYVSGPIAKVAVDFNTKVDVGQLLAQIDPAPYEVKVRQVQAALATAEARLKEAKASSAFQHGELSRVNLMFINDTASEGKMDTALLASDRAEAQLMLATAGVTQAQASLDEAQINLSYTNIVSPIAGTVLAKYVEVGQTVAASFQTPDLFLIAGDLSEMQIRAQVSEIDIAQVQAGQAVTFTADAWPDRTFGGVVTQRRNAPIDRNGVITYDVMVSVDNREGLLVPGMTVSVNIVIDRVEDVLAIPLRALNFEPNEEDISTYVSSLYPSEGKHVWFIASTGKLTPIPVEVQIQGMELAGVSSDVVVTGAKVVIAYVVD